MIHRSARRGPGRRLAALTAVVAISTFAAACGGNSPSSSNTTTAAPSTDAATEGTPGAVSDTADASGDTVAVTEPAETVPVFTNAPTTTAEAAPEPVSGGTLTVAVEADSTGYNPTADAWGRAGHQVAHAIFDPLATTDAEGKVVPYLAESITANEDSTVWTITLREGISFHDGEPLNADAVKVNFEAVLASPQYKAQLALVTSMTVVDDLTLDIQMSAPWGAFPQALVGDVGTQIGYIAAPAMLADPAGGRTPIGTGPFTFVEWVPDDHLTVARNDGYWQGAPYLEEVVFKPIPDSTSRKAAFDADDVDLYYTAVSSEIIEFQEDDSKTVVVGSPSEPDMIMFNTSVAPLDDVRVRRALAMAVDVPRIFDFLDATGVKQELDSPYPLTSFWHVDSEYPAFDPDEAARLIEEYEAEVGPVTFNFSGNQDPFLVSLQELYQSMWADVGADASIISKAQSENISDVVGGNYQVIMWGGQGGGDPDRDYDYFHSGGLNFTRYNSPEIDAALDAGRALSDPDARKAQYAILQEAFGRDVPYIWTGTNQFAVITPTDVIGIADFTLPDGTPGAPVVSGMFFLKDVWLAS